LLFGVDKKKGIRLDGFSPQVVQLEEGFSADDLWIHDEKDLNKAQMLTRIFDSLQVENRLPRPFGVFYSIERPCYEDTMQAQIQDTITKKGIGNLDQLIAGKETWTVL
jgi:2-oxoglutarate ferredoxin oxidoreductase subunit beta